MDQLCLSKLTLADQIQLVLDGYKRVDVWMYANFPTGSNDTLPNAPSSLSVQHSMVVQEERVSIRNG